ncbi:MAG: chloride channel protein [Gammaproteobacteria bacterium]|nr:chloride channel protein [Gammaproteobacteria bacterium]NIR98145.1 chloride channel protein [Gammaproteobacteria bacterium]NIT62532.1 chloride channel protein [Gammaproteobacteria bacterium]NIV20789.1 chloride channel protein [Gammaproteobacteria bacterium]NIY31112.1 chloride channel protein [Gammaproteobacteria bacterium]
MPPNNLRQRLQQRAAQALDQFRLKVSRPDALPELALLGIVAGVLAGITIVAFRLLVEWAQESFLPGAAAGNHEALPPQWRLILPALGGLVIGLVFQLVRHDARRVGVLHVMERLAYHQGHLPWRNALMQFVGGAIALVCGHSIGREGPSAHLGAASANLPAQALALPNNSLRVLAACGAAAGIAASFNTPLAGVAFSMEVLVMEYTVAGFAPVILATVSATMITRVIYGDDVAFSVPPVALGSLYELPFIMLAGVAIGLAATAFITLLRVVARYSDARPVWLRLSAAGALVGACGVLVPEIMGISHDTVNRSLLGELGLATLLAIVALKMLATTVGIGLGLPGGIIGPSLVVGAAAGGLLGLLAHWSGFPDASPPGLYVLIGMGAMMAGTLQAPLAGLIAILELTGNPNVILPGMLAVIAATITTARLYEGKSVFQVLIQSLGLDYRNDPVSQSLRRVGVGAVMDRSVEVLPRWVDAARADDELARDPHWILVREAGQPEVLLAAVDLVRERKGDPEAEEYDLLDLPGTRLQTAGIDMQASLQEALEIMTGTGAEALYVTRETVPGLPRVYGVLTRQNVETAYRH